MIHANIRSVFDDYCASLHFDKNLFRKVCDMESSFVNKKQSHIEFFGGTLTGVLVVRFTPSDYDKLFDDVLEVDQNVLKEACYEVKDNAGALAIVQSRFVTSDIFNIATIWLIHAFHNSPHLSQEQRQEAKIRVCCYVIYKHLTSLIYNGFKYPADPDIAKACYAQLSFKYALKQLGSWGATIRDLAEKAVSLEGIHAETIEKMDDDARVLYMVADIQGRIRDMFKNIYVEHLRVKEKGIRIASSSSFVESDGELILKDSSKNPGSYARYLKTIVSDKNAFIKQELVDIVLGVMQTASPRLTLQTLKWTSEHYQNNSVAQIDQAIDAVLEHAIEYTMSHRAIARTDIASLVDKLRGAYMSSRSTDTALLACRASVEHIVRSATNSTNEGGIAAVRTAWMLYIVIRAYTQRHYTSH